MGGSEKIDCRANGEVIFLMEDTSTPQSLQKCLDGRGAAPSQAGRQIG